MGIPHQRAIEPLGTYRALAAFVVAIVFTGTSTLSVILRLIAKRMKRKDLGSEDYTILAAQVVVYAMATCVFLVVFIGGAGHPASDVGPVEVRNFLKILVALQICYATSLGLIKTSICLFYIRIFFTRPFRIAAKIVIVLIVGWSFMVILTAFLLCRPLAYNWDQTIPEGSCANQPAAFIAIGALDVFVDCLVIGLPLPMIWNLQISRSNKIVLSGIFGLGLLTMIISILRIKSLVSVAYTDITNTAAYPLLWSFLEPAIGVTVACGPLMRPLFEKVFPGPLIRKTRTSKGNETFDFERLDEPVYSLNNLEPPNVSVVTSSGRGGEESKGSNEHILDSEREEQGPLQVSEDMRGITVKREFYTHRG